MSWDMKIKQCPVCWHETLEYIPREYDGGFACLGPAEWSCSTCGYFGNEVGGSYESCANSYIEFFEIKEEEVTAWREGQTAPPYWVNDEESEE